MLSWDRRPQRDFFLRAETFLDTVTAYDWPGGRYAGLSRMSHGESVVGLLARLEGTGLLLLADEPEAGLSVTGQLAVLRRLHELVAEGAQVVCATHSPILPGPARRPGLRAARRGRRRGRRGTRPTPSPSCARSSAPPTATSTACSTTTDRATSSSPRSSWACAHDSGFCRGSAAVASSRMSERDEDVTDELPDDLVAAGYVGPVRLPRQRPPPHPGGALRRRSGSAASCVWALAGDDAVLVNGGVLAAGIGLLLVAAVLVAGRVPPRRRRARRPGGGEPRPSASRSATPAPSSAGAACAAGRRGASCCTAPRSRPGRAGLVLVDGVDGEVLEHFTEANPEDWSALT